MYWNSPSRCLTGLLLLSLSVCAAADRAPRVVVSSKPVHSLVAGLMQGVGSPDLLIDGTTVPWEYEPDRAGRAAIRAADIVVWTGPELEPGLAPILAGAHPGRVLEVLANDQLKVLPARGDERRRDPFFWLDSRNMLILVDALARVLSAADPARAPVYERNRKRQVEAIAAIDRVMEFGYRGVSGVPVYFYYDTHRYFEQAYAMHLGGHVTDPVAPAEDATARLLELKGRLAAGGEACLFGEQALDEPHLDLVLTGLEIEPIELDTLGVSLKPGPDLYVELMRRNFETIATCVGARKPSETALEAEPGRQRLVGADEQRFPERVIPRYLMADQYGRTHTVEDFAGQLQLIYFGYTYCPDICPTSLAVMARALKQLGPEAEQIQPLFITVDPERDTPQKLAEYTAYFHPRMLGLSASPEVTRRIAELFKVRVEKVPDEDGDPDRYTMDHTSSLYLLGRDGEFITKFAHGLPAQQVAERLREYLRE